MRKIKDKTTTRLIIAGFVIAALLTALFIVALAHVSRTTPQRMEQIGSSSYYDQVMREHQNR